MKVDILKKWLAVLAALSLSTALVACGDDDDDDDDDTAPTTTDDDDDDMTDDDDDMTDDDDDMTDDDDDMTDDDDADCSTPVDAAESVGNAYLVDASADTLSDTCASPPTNPLICSQLPGLIGDAAIRIALYVAANDGSEMTLIAGILDENDQQDGEAIEIPPVDFSGNPCFSAFLENFSIDISDLSINVLELAIEGSVASDLESVNVSVFRLSLDASALTDLVGIDVCTLGICQPDGSILLELHGITANKVDGVVISL
jgi:hypothetical protein